MENAGERYITKGAVAAASNGPHPIIYIAAVAGGYYAGQQSHGSWVGFLTIVAVFIACVFAIKFLRYLWSTAF